MSTGGDGAIFAEIALSLGQMQAQVDKAVQLSGKVGKALKDIPDAKPTLNTQSLEAGATKATGILGQLTAALGPGLSAAAGPAQQVLAQATEGMTKVGTASTLASGGLGLAAGGLTAAAGLAATAGVALLKLGQSYEAGFRQIAARTGETGDALKGLEASLTSLGTRSIAPTEKIAAVMIQVRQRTGEVGTELEATSLAMLKYSKATGSDAVEATGSLLRIFNAFHIAVADQKDAMDAFVKVQQTTGISDAALREGIQATGAIFRGYGLDIKETAAVIGLLDEAGINAQQVTAGLRRALGNITGPDAKAQLFGLIADLGAMDDKELATARATDLFGTRSAAAILDMARNGKLSLASMNEALAGHQGAVDQAADDLKSAWEKIGLQIKRAEKEWTPTAVLMAQAASDFATATLDAMGRAGKAIDDFLAKPSTRAAAALFLRATGAGGAEGAPAGPALPAPGFAVPGGAKGTQGLTADAETEAQQALDAVLAQRIGTEADLSVGIGQRRVAEEAATASAGTGAEATARVLAGYLVAKAGVVDYAAAIAAGGTAHQAFIESTLREQEASDHLTKSIAAMTDTHEKAVAITLQHAAADATGAERAALFAQAEAVAKAGTDSRIAGLATLAGAILPQLSAAEAAYVKELEASKDPQAEAAFLAAKFGVSVEELNAKLAGSGASLAEFAKQAAAAARPLAEFVGEETTSRITSAMGALASGADAGTAALAKQLTESGHAGDALTLLAGHYGASREQAEQWARALTEGGAAAELAKTQMGVLTAATGEAGVALFKAKEAIAAFTTYARNASGQIDLKVNVDVAAAQTQIQNLTTSYQEGNKQRAESATDLSHTEALATRDFQRQIEGIRATHDTALDEINAARSASASQLGSDLAAVTGAENKALANVAVTERAAATTYQNAITDATAQHGLAFATAAKTYKEGVKTLAEQTAAAIEQVAKAQAAGLQQLSAAMTQFNQQQVQSAFTASVALQNSQNAANGFTDTQSVASAVRSAQVQAEGAAGIAQANASLTLSQSQNSIAQQQVDAQKALTQATIDAAKQMVKLSDDLKNAKIAASVQLGNAQTAATTGLLKSRAGEDYYNAQNVDTKTVQMIDGVPYIVEGTQRAVGPGGTTGKALTDLLGITPGGTTGTRDAATSATQQQGDAAQGRFDARTAQLNKAEAAAERRQREQTQAALEARQEQVRQFDKQEAAQRETQRKADKAYADQLHALKVQEGVLQELQAHTKLLEKIRGGGTINGPVTIQETSKEMLQYASTRAPAVLKV